MLALKSQVIVTLCVCQFKDIGMNLIKVITTNCLASNHYSWSVTFTDTQENSQQPHRNSKEDLTAIAKVALHNSPSQSALVVCV